MKSHKATLTAFLKAWKNENPKAMHNNTTKTWQSTHAKSAFLAKVLESFEITSHVENGPIADFQIVLNGDAMKVRLVKERAPYRGADKDQTEDDIELCKKFKLSSAVAWGVNPVSFKPVK